MKLNQSNRLWEIDALRGIAILMMLIYHSLMDIEYVFEKDFYLVTGFWKYFQIIGAIFFLGLVGISFTLSHARKRTPQYYLIRGGKIFLFGMLITVLTRVILEDGFVIFGVLHLIGVSTMLAPVFLRFKKLNLFLGILLVVIGFYLDTLTFPFTTLVWLGFIPDSFFSFDYFPLLPWFGFILLGIYAGKIIYPDSKRCFYLTDLSGSPPIQCLTFLGRHSLLIYLLHQPVLLGVFYLTALYQGNS